MNDPDQIVDAMTVETIEPTNRAEAVVYLVNRVLHWLGAVVLALLMAMTVVDVIGRKFFDHPFKGSIELTEVGLVLLIFLSLGFAQHFDDHVSIDLIYERLPAGGRWVMALVAATLAAVIGLFMVWRMYLYSNVLEAGGYETATWHIPLYVVARLAAAGCLLFVLAMLVTVRRLVEKPSPVTEV